MRPNNHHHRRRPLEKLERALRRVEYEMLVDTGVGLYAKKIKADHTRLITEIARLQMEQKQAAPAPAPVTPSFAAAAPMLPFPAARNTRVTISKALKSTL